MRTRPIFQLALLLFCFVLFDDQPTQAVGSIAMAPSDANVIYVGSGEANICGNLQPGIGIFRSTDGGKNWKHVWKQQGQIGTIIVHPKNPDTASSV